MAESNSVGATRGSGGVDLLRQITGASAANAGGQGPVVAASSGGGASGGNLAGPRGNRILPADTPLDQLDRRAARGTYIDILV